jgi:ABC-type nickel/cobalt efflux system permease component RcnA
MSDALFPALTITALTVGALHALAPDHWVPFAALARARGWTPGRTARLIALCGTGHVGVSVALGLLALLFGASLLDAFGRRLEAISGILLVGFGLGYGLWGLRRAVHARLHGKGDHHHHHHMGGFHVHVDGRTYGVAPHDHDRDERASRMTAWSLFTLFSVDPCVAVIPLLLASAPLGAARTIGIILAYEAAMLATMMALALPARAAVNAVRGPRWIVSYADAAAGAAIAAVGVVVGLVGW